MGGGFLYTWGNRDSLLGPKAIERFNEPQMPSAYTDDSDLMHSFCLQKSIFFFTHYNAPAAVVVACDACRFTVGCPANASRVKIGILYSIGHNALIYNGAKEFFLGLLQLHDVYYCICILMWSDRVYRDDYARVIASKILVGKIVGVTGVSLIDDS